ncbi:MAG: 4-(cytidine 5'-diphospho)-2-C-methyl-D-erythritol kinase [Actinomycetaceae bacterium]|nr:4-(cytidine 5'-diphospho)-2-C-methyl-D-erythritol kinase [Actinomycetaceae bacterium]
MHHLEAVTASAPGKINLQLLVGKPDSNGYHPLYSIFETVGLRETCIAKFTPQREHLSGSPTLPNSTPTLLAHTASGYPITVRTSVELGSSVADAQALQQLNDVAATDHLAWKAAAKLVEKAAEIPEYQLLPKETQLDLTIIKRIPAAGGMAGGSADAAATLVAVNELLGLRLSNGELEKIARTLGADVPACLTGGTSLGLGYGDHMTRLDTYFSPQTADSTPGHTHHWVMVMSPTGLSTPAVFKAFDAANAGRPLIPAVTDLTEVLTHDTQLPKALCEAKQMAEIMENDLQETAFALRPDVAQVHQYLETLGAHKVMLSGSGPTLAVLAENEAAARALGEKISTHPQVAGVLITSGPGLPAMVEKTQ